MFSKKGTYLPTEMFSLTHVVASVVCLAVVLIGVYLVRDLKKENNKKFHIIISSVFSGLIIMEIVYEIYVKNISLQSLLPLSVNFLVLVSMLLLFCKNKTICLFSKTIIAYVGVGYGVFSLIFLIPSITNYPIFHIECLIQMFTASIMLFAGLTILVKKEVEINIKSLKIALCILFDFVVDCLIINLIFDTNYLFLISPQGINLPFLNGLYLFSSELYSVAIFMFYFVLILSVFVVYKCFEFMVDKYNKD